MLLSFFYFVLLCSPQAVQARPSQAIVAVSKGDGRILSVENRRGKMLSFEGKKYWYHKARVGKKVNQGDLVQCGPNCKLRLNFPNGDHIFVAPGTTIEIPKLDKDGGGKGSSMEVFYGKFRSIISKKGPRKELKIKSKSAVAGVRGTDFFTASYPHTGTHISVFRGQVEMTTTGGEETQLIKAAETGEVLSATPQELKTHSTNSGEIDDILRAVDTSKIPPPPDMSPEVQKLVADSNVAALEMVREEIMEETPEVFQGLEEGDREDVDKLSRYVVARNQVQAPKGEVNWEQTSPESTSVESLPQENIDVTEEKKQWRIFELGYLGTFQDSADSHFGSVAYTPLFWSRSPWWKLRAHVGIGGLQSTDVNGNDKAKLLGDLGVKNHLNLMGPISFVLQLGLQFWPDSNYPPYVGLGVSVKNSWIAPSVFDSLYGQWAALEVESEFVHQARAGVSLNF